MTMEQLFLILTDLSAVALISALVTGYWFSRKGRPSPKGLNAAKLAFLILYCVFWFLWNWMRNL
jgi:hypothetical protein